ncbi:MAG: hypothetical protein ABI584_11015 [Acidobacteriota bacterium]
MQHSSKQILAILDACCETFTFPMLDNGYVYLAASRLSLFHSTTDWALVIEIFGYSPRGDNPDIHVHTFASRLHARDPREKFVSEQAYVNYLANYPNNDSRFFYPIDGSWQDEDNSELVSTYATHLSLRGASVAIPSVASFGAHGISLEEPGRIRVFELCRFLAATHRELVLGTSQERRVSIVSGMRQILQLEEWRHPDLISDELPSTSLSFQQLAEVLVTGDPSHYRGSEPSNTHWSNWPEGGTL